jgi:hypothetical protein
MLKLYYGRPLMINENIDVAKCIANGAMTEFRGVVLQDGVTENDLETIIIDGYYYVRCASVCQIKALRLKMLDGVKEDEEVLIDMELGKALTVRAKLPLPLDGEIDKSTLRIFRRVSMKQFPVVCANARTCHKLQGRTIENLVISTFANREAWVYVALSRVTTIKGLYLRVPLANTSKLGMTEKMKRFMAMWREKGTPPRVKIRFEEYT